MPVKIRRTMDVPTFSSEQEADLALSIRAFRDVCADLGLAKDALEAIGALIERLVRDALGRSNPNRRVAFLEQWSGFLCRLAEELQRKPMAERKAYFASSLQDFKMYDAKGRKGTRQEWNERANVWVEKDGQRWQACAPPATLDAEPLIELTDLDAGHSPTRKGVAEARVVVGNGKEVPWPSKDIPKAQLLKPMDTPAVLLQEYERLYAELQRYADRDLRRPDVRSKVFAGIPTVWIERWFEGRIQKSDLALLAAAWHVGLTPSGANLSSFREVLAGARQAKRLSEERVKDEKKIVIVDKERNKRKT